MASASPARVRQRGDRLWKCVVGHEPVHWTDNAGVCWYCQSTPDERKRYLAARSS